MSQPNASKKHTTPPTPALKAGIEAWFFRRVYPPAFWLLGAAYLPHLIRRMGQAEDPRRFIRERFGFYRPEDSVQDKGQRLLWIHAVSVGEVMAVTAFVREFLNRRPEMNILLTTVTPTGQKIARSLEGPRLKAVYFPLDFVFCVRRFLKFFRPEALLLVETEIWPNVLLEASRAGIPAGIVNARLSEKSRKRYGLAGPFFRPLFGRISFVFAQTREDAVRFIQLGVPKGRVAVAGNMKFDHAVPERNEKQLEEWKRKWGLKPEHRLWMAGSTHRGEEEALLRIFEKLKTRFRGLKLVLAPRHPERAGEVLTAVQRCGLKGRFSASDSREDFEVLVVNELGILRHLYALADVVFMGGSLVKHGGQNPIEPAQHRRAILYGPHVFNFESVYRELKQAGGAVGVQNEEELLGQLERLLEQEQERKTLGERAYAAVEASRGATARHLEWIGNFISLTTLERTCNAEQHEKLFPPVGGRV